MALLLLFTRAAERYLPSVPWRKSALFTYAAWTAKHGYTPNVIVNSFRKDVGSDDL